MTNHAYIPSRILGQDDLSTLTSFNLYDATRDEGDQDNVFSRILHKVRGAVTNNESYQPSHSSSFSSKVYSNPPESVSKLTWNAIYRVLQVVFMVLVESWEIQEQQRQQ